MKNKKNKLFLWFFAFGFLFAFFHIMPALLTRFLRSPLTFGDALDFLTPFAVIPLAYGLYYQISKTFQSEPSLSKRQRRAARIILALAFLLYADGHGLHLSSNSIARLIQNREGSELFKATYLYDEIISHFMWDGGVYLISIGLIVVALRIAFQPISRSDQALLLAGAIFYGFTFTVNGIEGQTVLFTFPAAVFCFILSFLLYKKSQKKGIQNPVLLFFLSAYFLSSLLFTYWGLSHSSFPQFSELGWI